MGNTSASEDNFCDLFLFLEFSVKVFKKREREKGEKAFTLTAGGFPADMRGSVRIEGKPLSSVFSWCSTCVRWPLLWRAFPYDLHWDWNLVVLEYFVQPVWERKNVESLCLLRPVAYSSVAFVRAEVWHRTCSSESCFSTGLVSAGAFSSSPHLVPAAHWCTVCLFSVCSRSSVCVVAYCSCIGVFKKKISVLGPDLLPQPVGEEVEAVRRRLPNIGKEAQWRREIAPVEAWAGNPNLLVGLLIWWFMHF